jgi:hypothetical protein
VFSVTSPQSGFKQTILAYTLLFALAPLVFKNIKMDLLLQELLYKK